MLNNFKFYSHIRKLQSLTPSKFNITGDSITTEALKRTKFVSRKDLRPGGRSEVKAVRERTERTTSLGGRPLPSEVGSPPHVHLREEVEGRGLLDEVLHLSGRRQGDLDHGPSAAAAAGLGLLAGLDQPVESALDASEGLDSFLVHDLAGVRLLTVDGRLDPVHLDKGTRIKGQPGANLNRNIQRRVTKANLL